MTEQTYAFELPLTQLADDPLGYNGRLVLPAEEVEALPVREDGSRRFVCRVEDAEPWHAAFVPDGMGQYFILVNQRRIDAWRAAGYDLARLSVVLTPDASTYGMAMPAELGTLLDLDEEGDEYFHALTPGKQRALIHQVASAKREATRLKRAVGIVEYLKSARGKLDFRELQQSMRAR